MKATIIGALGYFICPLDVISDVIPVAGYTDDAGVLAMCAIYIDADVEEKAKNKVNAIFG